MGIRWRLLVLVMGVAIPLVGVGLAGLLWMRSESQRKYDFLLTKQSELAAAAFEGWINAQQQSILTIAASVAEKKKQERAAAAAAERAAAAAVDERAKARRATAAAAGRPPAEAPAMPPAK